MENIRHKAGKYMLLGALVLSVMLFSPCYVFGLGGGGFRNEAALDAEANGKASAFVAQADSPSAVHFNPAGLVQLKGDHVTVGYTYEAPRNSMTDSTGQENEMQKQTFSIPNFYYASDLGRENLRFGFSVTSPYGLGTDWADDSFSRFQATESDLTFYQINPTLACKINDALSIGLGIDHMSSDISKHKRIFDTTGLGDFHLKGKDSAWGYNVGLLFKPSDKQSVGISYRSEIELTYRGTASLTNLDSGIYAAFFPDNYSTDVKSKLTLPRTIAVGYAYRPNEKWTVEIDCEWTGWSSVQEDFVRYPSESNPNRLAVLNDGNPASKDWNDSLAYGVGAEYDANDRLALRCGYLFYQTPIPSATFETALPDSDRHAATLGLGYKINDGLTIDASYFGVLYVDRDVTNDVASAKTNLDGEYEGYMNIVSVGFTYKY